MKRELGPEPVGPEAGEEVTALARRAKGPVMGLRLKWPGLGQNGQQWLIRKALMKGRPNKSRG